MDVTGVHGSLMVYMKQPEAFEFAGKESLVFKLRKSLYGLNKCPRCWNSVLDDHLKRSLYLRKGIR